ncbi:MAG: hypothetical protein DRJ06_05370 [Candidatus Aminicenantes bacterium]|nr:MAG: hypothetical protein DRJ06_05370 [Candidatus Aminicenantes bacterium]
MSGEQLVLFDKRDALFLAIAAWIKKRGDMLLFLWFQLSHKKVFIATSIPRTSLLFNTFGAEEEKFNLFMISLQNLHFPTLSVK